MQVSFAPVPLVATAIDIPDLAGAAAARGLRLVSMSAISPANDVAALIGAAGDPVTAIAQTRAKGWTGPLMIALHRDCIAQALDAGADDAIRLPACPDEVAARLAARLRPRTLILGELRIDLVARQVSRAGKPLHLLYREYALLLHLARQPGRRASRAELLAQIWGLRFDPGTNVVQVHVSRLRAKLDRGFPFPMLHTDKGKGYYVSG